MNQSRLTSGGEALRQAVHRLRSEGVDSPRLDAELLLAHALNTNRAAVLARPERPLTPKELTSFRELVRRRAAREPLAYIVGHREFFGLMFRVDPRVLIPRPETELLVERALQAGRVGTEPVRIADVGTGSGAVSVTLAVHLPEAIVYALDDSAGALAVTADNARRHGVAERVCCLQGDLLAPLTEPVDIITANLPYVSTDEWDSLAPEIREYEPRSALDGGADGLDAIRRLLATAGQHLRPSKGEVRDAGAVVLLEIGASQGAAVTELARQHFERASVELCPDYAGLDRVLVITTASSSR
jgi:release factor glutamine methyltransferase